MVYFELKNDGQVIGIFKAERDRLLDGTSDWFFYKCQVESLVLGEDGDPTWRGEVPHRMGDGVWKLIERAIHKMREHPDGS